MFFSKISYIQTNAALEEASSFANEILYSDQRNRSRSPIPTVHHDHFHWGHWGYPEPIYCGPFGTRFETSRNRSEKRDQSWVAIPAAAIALVTMYFIGQNHAEWSQTKESIMKLRQSNLRVRRELDRANAHPALKSTVQNVFEKRMIILDRIRSHAATGLLLKSILITSMTAIVIGGLAGNYFVAASLKPLLSYGAGSSFLTSAAMLYRAGFSSKDTAMKEEARSLQIAVKQAGRVMQEVGY